MVAFEFKCTHLCDIIKHAIYSIFKIINTMKIKSKFLITILIVCFTNMATYANDVFFVKKADDNSFVIQLPNKNYSEIQVILKDIDGLYLYDATVKQSSLYQRKFNLKELPPGNYFLMVTYDSKTKVQPIIKTKNSLEIEAKDLRTIVQPVFKQHADYFDLNMICFFDLKVTMEIRDSEGNVLYSDMVQPNGSLHKRFNLSMLDAGLYTFTLGMEDYIIDAEFTELIEWSPDSEAFYALY